MGLFEKDNAQKNPNAGMSDEELAHKFRMLADRLGMTIAVPALPSRG